MSLLYKVYHNSYQISRLANTYCYRERERERENKEHQGIYNITPSLFVDLFCSLTSVFTSLSVLRSSSTLTGTFGFLCWHLIKTFESTSCEVHVFENKLCWKHFYALPSIQWDHITCLQAVWSYLFMFLPPQFTRAQM